MYTQVIVRKPESLSVYAPYSDTVIAMTPKSIPTSVKKPYQTPYFGKGWSPYEIS